MIKTKKIHHSWFILMVTLGIMGGLVGVLINCTGIIFAEIIKEFGFKTGDLSIYYTVRSLTRAAALGFVSNLFFTKNSKKVLVSFTAVTCIAYMSMAFYTQLWQWYISAFFIGVGTSYTGMAVSVLLANWFHSKKGFVMGIAMSSAGALGAVVSPLCSHLISTIGWRGACIVLGLIAFVIVSIPAGMFLVLTPEEVGEKPYGYGQTAETSTAQITSVSYKVPAYIFYAAVTVICLSCLINQVLNLMPLYASSLGYTVNTGAMLTSFAMIGNVTGKLRTGWLTDRTDIYKTLSIAFTAIILSLLMFMMFPQSEYMLYAAALMFGTIFAIDANIPPLLFMEIWGADYTKYLKNFQTIAFAIGACSASLIPYIYDFTQSYNVLFVLGIIFVSVSFALLWWLKGWLDRHRKA